MWNSRCALVLVLVMAVQLAGCRRRVDPAALADLPLRPRSVEAQTLVARDALALWQSVPPLASWADITQAALGACGSSVRVDEVIELVAFHPRTRVEWFWRAEVEGALKRRGGWQWDPGNAARCRVIREAEAAAPVAASQR